MENNIIVPTHQYILLQNIIHFKMSLKWMTWASKSLDGNSFNIVFIYVVVSLTFKGLCWCHLASFCIWIILIHIPFTWHWLPHLLVGFQLFPVSFSAHFVVSPHQAVTHDQRESTRRSHFEPRTSALAEPESSSSCPTFGVVRDALFSWKWLRRVCDAPRIQMNSTALPLLCK